MSFTVLPVPKPAVVHSPYRWLAALQVLDVATTWWVLHYWSTRSEGNPLIGHLLDGVGLPAGMFVLLVLKLAMVYVLWTCQTPTRIALSVYSLVVLNNIVFLVLWLLS